MFPSSGASYAAYENLVAGIGLGPTLARTAFNLWDDLTDEKIFQANTLSSQILHWPHDDSVVNALYTDAKWPRGNGVRQEMRYVLVTSPWM